MKWDTEGRSWGTRPRVAPHSAQECQCVDHAGSSASMAQILGRLTHLCVLAITFVEYHFTDFRFAESFVGAHSFAKPTGFFADVARALPACHLKLFFFNYVVNLIPNDMGGDFERAR